RAGGPTGATLREWPDRARRRADVADAGQTRHRLPDRPPGLHAIEHTRWIRESGSVADRDLARAVDDRRVLHVEIVRDQRGPHESGLDPDPEIPRDNRGPRTLRGPLE